MDKERKFTGLYIVGFGLSRDEAILDFAGKFEKALDGLSGRMFFIRRKFEVVSEHDFESDVEKFRAGMRFAVSEQSFLKKDDLDNFPVVFSK